MNLLQRIGDRLYDLILSVPVHVKIAGLVLLPVIVLGLSLNYWVASGLQDWLSYLLTDVRVEAAMRAGRRSVQLVTVLGAVGSLVVAYFLTFILTRPLLALRKMAQRVAAGDLTARARIDSNDEIGELAAVVNVMTDRLVTSQAELTRSNRHQLRYLFRRLSLLQEGSGLDPRVGQGRFCTGTVCRQLLPQHGRCVRLWHQGQ